MEKQNAIINAWLLELGQEKYDSICLYVDYEDGGIKVIEGIADRVQEIRESLGSILADTKKFIFNGYKLYLSTLSGIENNNGWTRVESDEMNLPKYGTFQLCEVKFESGGSGFHFWNEDDWFTLNGQKSAAKITHYKFVEKSNDPIF